jgi:hypothetical protein
VQFAHLINNQYDRKGNKRKQLDKGKTKIKRGKKNQQGHNQTKNNNKGKLHKLLKVYSIF